MSVSVAAARLAVGRPTWWAWAIAGFLARGGVLLFALPILALPTPIGVANFFGADAVTLDGPASWVVGFGSAVAILVVLAIVAGGLVGALSDRLLVRAAVPGVVAPPASLVALLLIRLLCLAPVVLLVAGLAPRIAQVGYQELILPDDFVTPYVLRVVAATRNELALIVAAWVASETIGGLAVRHAVLWGTGAWRSVGRGLVELARHPASTFVVLVITVAGMVVVLVPAIGVIAVAWDVVGHVASSPEALPQVAVAAVLLVTVWLAAMAMVGIVAAWRSAAWSLEVARHLP